MTTAIENDVPMPTEEPPKPKPKSRGRKAAAAGTTKKTPNPAATLIAALKFISPAQKKVGPTGVQFSHIAHNWAAASDGVLTIAHPVEEDLTACPNTLQFIEALSKAGDELSITQLSESSLAVSSGAFRALVPCVTFEEVPIYPPDPQCAAIDDRIKDALLAVMGMATDGAPAATFAAVLLQANSAVATNGAGLLEYWHGIDLPPGLLIPKASAAAIAKAGKTLTGFGFSQSSATFYYEGGAFIKTQLFGERYPNYAPVLDLPNINAWPVPEELFKGIRAIETFTPNGNVFFQDGSILSNMQKDMASTYRIEGLPERMGFSIKNLLLVEDAFKTAHFDPTANKVVFFGENIRGALMGLDLGTETPYNKEPEEEGGSLYNDVEHIAKRPKPNFSDMDDDIPF